MKRLAALTLVLGLVAVACGDDDAGSTDTAAATTAAPAATTATTAAATTTAAPATTEAAGNPLVEAALEFVGDHSGEWNNTTFGSSGSMDLSVAVDEASEMLMMTVDLGGFVFGGDDPDPVEYEFDLSIGSPDVDVYQFDVDDPVFGVGTMEFEGFDFRWTAEAVPGVGGLPMVMEGQFTPTGFEGTYTIEGLAEGTFEVVAGN